MFTCCKEILREKDNKFFRHLNLALLPLKLREFQNFKKYPQGKRTIYFEKNGKVLLNSFSKGTEDGDNAA